MRKIIKSYYEAPFLLTLEEGEYGFNVYLSTKQYGEPLRHEHGHTIALGCQHKPTLEEIEITYNLALAYIARSISTIRLYMKHQKNLDFRKLRKYIYDKTNDPFYLFSKQHGKDVHLRFAHELGESIIVQE